QVAALHLHRGEVYAGGYFEYAAAPPAWAYTGALARWTGDGWGPVDQGALRGWINTMASFGDQLVIGSSGLSAGSARSSVLAWDGASWSDLGGPLEGYVTALTPWQGSLVAGGGVRVPGQTSWSGVAIHRGQGWWILGEPLVTDQTSVNALAVFRDQLFV